MKNFPFEHDGKTYWYSRSVACTMYLFVYERSTHRWYILVAKRGPGCPNNVGKWNCPGGFLDFDETAAACAVRECYEETGVSIVYPRIIPRLAAITTDLGSIAQNVVFSFYGTIKVNHIHEISKNFTTMFSEPDEVSGIDLWNVDVMFKDPKWFADNTAFEHDKMIKEIYKQRIICPWWKRLIIDLFVKYTAVKNIA